ncbi:unnamed protein product [Trichogramma brassicae]|uniref:Uncharacterized protein n=1 Tax=Trichogramma brassicae TaxID=86971 RepID=A0A6H5J332_9HYME|nr:unnamed protein product [Trichogramma brassicae]
MAAITCACDASMTRTSGRCPPRSQSIGGRMKSPCSGAHVCDRGDWPREHVAGQMNMLPRQLCLRKTSPMRSNQDQQAPVLEATMRISRR